MRSMAIFHLAFVFAMLFLLMSCGLANDYDYLEGGYVRSTDRYASMEPGISGMVRWLDLPVPGSTFIPYREYYTTVVAPMPSISGYAVTAPAPYNITGREPQGVYYRNGQWIAYPIYRSSRQIESNDLWISGQNNWTQYAAIPVGSSIQLLMNAPAGGMGSLFKLVQTNSLSADFSAVQLSSGYSSMNFVAGQPGRHMLYFVLNNQASNVVVIDVFSQAP